VTRGEIATFVTATGHRIDGGCTTWTDGNFKQEADKSWRSPGFTQTDRHPAVCVNWNDAKAYVAWLASATGRSYRLLSEPEREYVARAATTTPFWWGSSITPTQANYDGNYVYTGDGSKGERRKATVPVDSFAANPWGLHNVHGNVHEWTEDCRYASSTDGSAGSTNECRIRIIRGGGWSDPPQFLRSANRNAMFSDDRSNSLGFCVARTLTP
jgi:formylglycine-generating enzyme required for sulfatase activity